jgi:LacI family transcriptional regulator
LAVTRHLLEIGRRRIVHIAGPAANFEASERRAGFLDAVGACQDASGTVLDGDFSEEAGYAAGRRLAEIGERPEAVFAANDMMALGCLRALREAGLRTPEDVAVAGFDDIPIARLIGLTTLRTDIADLGRRALEHLAASVDGGGEVRIDIIRPELVVRNSTAGAADTHRGN